MKKSIVILLLAFFAIGLTSCAEDFTETDPIVPEISIIDDAPDNEKSAEMRRKRKSSHVGKASAKTAD